MKINTFLNAGLSRIGSHFLKSPKNQINDQEPITIYSHGCLCNKLIAKIFHTSIQRRNKICPNAFMIGPMKSFNYSDYLNPFSTYLAQENDVKRLHQACAPYKKVILVGVSRGASTIINYLGNYKPTNIIAAVIESPFDHFDNILEHVMATHIIYKRIINNNNKQKVKRRLLRVFCRNYKYNGLHPIDAAPNISKDIPLLIISSDQDKLIPAWSTKNIYDALTQAGHKKSYLLACKNGSHGLISWGKDGALMRNVIHAFYKHHDIPHHEPWAQEGYEEFMKCHLVSSSKSEFFTKSLDSKYL